MNKNKIVFFFVFIVILLVIVDFTTEISNYCTTSTCYYTVYSGFEFDFISLLINTCQMKSQIVFSFQKKFPCNSTDYLRIFEDRTVTHYSKKEATCNDENIQ